MKIILILSDKLNFAKSVMCNANTFLILQQKEKEASIINPTVNEKTNANYHFYASTHPSSTETIHKLFGKQDITIEPLLDEIVFSSTINKEMSYASYIKEAKKALKKNDSSINDNCLEFLRKLESLDEDAVVVTHPFILDYLINTMKKSGYLIEKPRLLGIQPLDRIRASKKNMHCGGCKHNCLLTSPKCDIGKDKAEIRGIEIKNKDSISSRF